MANVQKFAAEDAQRISVIRQGYIQSTTFVAELRLTSAAGHVITSLVSLDVDPACWTLSAVGVIGCHTGTLGPILELSLSRLEGLAREPRVPRGVALEAPLQVARGAPQFDVLLFQPELPRQPVFGDQAATRTRLLGSRPAQRRPKTVRTCSSVLCLGR